MKNGLKRIGIVLGTIGLGSTAHAQVPEECEGPPQPLLNVADVNADGVVDLHDVRIVYNKVQRAKGGNFYYGLYDLNGDSVLDGVDVAMAQEDVGTPVPAIETEVAMAGLYAERYLQFDNVIEDGHEATTVEFEGHGVHWWRSPRYRDDPENPENHFDPGYPGGLNLDSNGKLMAVYWGMDFAVYPMHSPPEGFTGHEDRWHMHTHACAWNYNTQDPERVTFIDYLPQRFGYYPEDSACYIEGQSIDDFWFGAQGSSVNTCTQPWLINYLMSAGVIKEPPPADSIANYNGFHMIHLWVNKPNPCGRFGATHPDVEGTPVSPDPPCTHGHGEHH